MEALEENVNDDLVAAKLKRLREVHGYTLERLARAGGMSTSHYWRCENERAPITVSALGRIVGHYGLTLTRFFAAWPEGLPQGFALEENACKVKSPVAK